MNLSEFFETVGGNYKEAISRFGSEDMIRLFLGKYLKDTSFEKLAKAVNEKDIKASFEAVHTLKGVAGNMCFQRLYVAASELTEQLRPQNAEAIPELYQTVCKEQGIIVTAIQEL